MKITLHLSPFDFSKTINDISFTKKLSAEKVESDYYINVVLFLMKKFYSCLDFNKYKHNNFIIDGETISPKQSIFDWTCLCNYLKNKLIELKLDFNFYKTIVDSVESLTCSLYYSSVALNTQKNISFSLKSATTIKNSSNNNDNDTKPSSSGSGGKSQMLVKPTEQELKKFFDEYNKIYAKPSNKNQYDNKKQILLKKPQSEVALDIAKSISKGVENFVKAADSISKNNILDGFSPKNLESKLNNMFDQHKPLPQSKLPFLTNQTNKPSLEQQKPIRNLQERSPTFEKREKTAPNYTIFKPVDPLFAEKSNNEQTR